MPFQAHNQQSLAQLVVYYKKLLLKLAAANKQGSSSTQDSTSAAAVQQSKTRLSDSIMTPEYSLERALSRLSQALLELDFQTMYGRYHSQKQKTKAKLRSKLQQALSSKYGRYLSSRSQQHGEVGGDQGPGIEEQGLLVAATSGQQAARQLQLEELFGSDGLFRVSLSACT